MAWGRRLQAWRNATGRPPGHATALPQVFRTCDVNEKGCAAIGRAASVCDRPIGPADQLRRFLPAWSRDTRALTSLIGDFFLPLDAFALR